ncbi:MULTISPECIES: alpha/beta hydrolase [Cyanophyceae]|uniref:alpha/beta hydrolase n=1 Tax=Cyanophyceae TaxID=3028117 RepID=UPI001682D750|nr:alpha/beta hydrolase [Trichocoleus sp. FACHB-69]MBD1930896.1 alpha/beta hydrolase [Trichocoleus sp. FACHB-69]
MKLGRFFLGYGIASTLAISSLFLSNPVQVEAQSTDAFIVFVNGSGDCCAEYMNQALDRLRRGVRGEIWTTSYANFRDGSSTVKAPVVNLSVNADALFIKEATEKINSLPSSRPVVLIGHSYGGDSILKVLPFITRRVQLVVVIDPVGTGGFRRVATERVVPPNVDYFMNRWQENGLTGQNVVPFDSRISGQLRCSATKGCDQNSANLARNTDGSEIRTDCRWDEVTCPGFVAPTPFRRGRKGTKAVRIEHNSMPQDAYIQHTVVEKIKVALRPFGVLK